MRVRLYQNPADPTLCSQQAHDMEGPPWIKHTPNDQVMLSLDGTVDHVMVVFGRAEWEDIKRRGDAALAGEDPNVKAIS